MRRARGEDPNFSSKKQTAKRKLETAQRRAEKGLPPWNPKPKKPEDYQRPSKWTV